MKTEISWKVFYSDFQTCNRPIAVITVALWQENLANLPLAFRAFLKHKIDCDYSTIVCFFNARPPKMCSVNAVNKVACWHLAWLACYGKLWSFFMLPYFWLHKLLPAHFLRPTVSLFLVQKLYCLRSLPLLQCNSRLHYNLTGFATPSDHFCFLSPQRPVSFPSVHVNYRN